MLQKIKIIIAFSFVLNMKGVNLMSSDKTSFLFQNKSLMLYLVVRICMALAMQMVTVAFGWQMYSLTKLPFFLGLVGLAQFLPMFLLTLVVGYVADHFDRRKIVCITQASISAGILFLAIATYNGWVTKETILVVVFFIGAVSSFQGPSMQAMLPNIVSKEQFPRATALASSAQQSAIIIGPALGGLLYAISPEFVYCLAGILILFNSITVLFFSVTQETSHREPVNFKSLSAGISFIWNKPIVLGAISLDLFAVLFGGATAMLPIYAAEILHIGPAGLGILRSAPAVGALSMSVYLAHHPLKGRIGRSMFAAVVAFGAATVVFSLSTSFILSLVALIILGSSDVISVVIRHTLVQMQTPDNMRGRVSSVNSMFIGTSNQLGEFESGVTAAWFGVVPAVMLGGICTITVVLLWTRFFPRLLNIDKFEHAMEEAKV